MAKKGLTHEMILEESIRLIEEKGYTSFSLRELAGRLDVQPASLYNHIQGIDEIYEGVAVKASEMMHRLLVEAMTGKDDDTAFIQGVYAYRRFTEEHPELYQALIHIPTANDELITKASFYSFEPLREIVHNYNLPKPDAVHFMRLLRSFIHGFAELSGNGLMLKSSVSKEDSFGHIVQQLLSYLKEYKNHE
jgi:AcrR family transcriptional regulator